MDNNLQIVSRKILNNDIKTLHKISNQKNIWNNHNITDKKCLKQLSMFTNNLNGTILFCNKKCLKYNNLSLYKLQKLIPYIPKEIECKQIIIGILEHISLYLEYNKKIENSHFLLLTSKEWSENLNKNFISCALRGLLYNNLCKYSIRILLPKNINLLLKNYNNKIVDRITLLELCIIINKIDNFNIFINKTFNKDYDILLLQKI